MLTAFLLWRRIKKLDKNDRFQIFHVENSQFENNKISSNQLLLSKKGLKMPILLAKYKRHGEGKILRFTKMR